MPHMVMIEPNPDFVKGKQGEALEAAKALYADAKRVGAKTVPYVSALGSVRRSKGLYKLKEITKKVAPVETRRIEDMDLAELKVMMLTLGIKTEKKMKRSDVEALIHRKMAEVDIVEDDG